MKIISARLAAITVVSTISVAHLFDDTESVNASLILDTPPIADTSLSLEDTPRNPTNRTVCEGRGCKPIYHSFGERDEREIVTHGERQYDAVVQMVNENGHVFCTATMAISEDFVLRQEGTLSPTAAHCLLILDKDQNIIGERKPENIFLHGSYINAQGEIENFHMQADETWINPLVYHGDWQDDTGFVFSRQLPPEDVILPVLVSIDFAESNQMQQEIEGFDDDEAFRVTSVGYAGDKSPLTAHKCAKIVSGKLDGMRGLNDIGSGSSGGSNYTNYPDCSPVLDENFRHEIIAVNSTVQHNSEHAGISYFNKLAMNSVPFLRPVNDPEGYVCEQQAQVVVTNKLNMRIFPGVSHPTLSVEEGKTTSALSHGDFVTVWGETASQDGKSWVLVSTEEGRMGYIRNHSNYIHTDSKHCVPEVPRLNLVSN